MHVNDVGAAIEAGVEAGRPYRISVTRFADQIADRRPAPAAAADRRPAGRRGVVVVAAGGRARRAVRRRGRHRGRPGNPSTGEVLAAIRATGAARVVVLPNDANAQAVASAAAAEEARGRGIRVERGADPVAGAGAGRARRARPGRRFEDDVIAMAEAAGACRYAEV